MLMMAMRGLGDSVTPLRFMILSVVIDIILNPLLILGVGPFPKLGIAGSALSTALAGALSLAAMIGWVYARDLPIRLRGSEWGYLWPRWVELRFILLKGLPMGAQMLIISASGLVMIGLVNREGLLTSAAYGATLQLWGYIQMPALAVGAGVSAMAAQNIGANRWDRVNRITWAGAWVNIVMTGALAAIVLLLDRPVLALFLGNGSAAIEVGRHIQLIGSWSFMLFGVTMVLFSTMRANGVVIAPLIIFAISLYAVRLGFYYSAYATLGADALWWSVPVSSTTSLIMAAAAYRFSGWERAAPALPAT